MLNPLIHKLPADTLHHIYCVLSFIDSLPSDDGESVVLNKDEAFGYHCIIRCVKEALRFECERTKRNDDNDEQQVNILEIAERINGVKHPRLRAKLLAEIKEAVYICGGG